MASLGLEANVFTPPASAESPPLPGEDPEQYVLRAARAKAESAANALSAPSSPFSTSDGMAPVIIAADTVVILEEKILGKPRDATDAHAMLRSLAGNTHRVSTGCVVLHLGRTLSSAEERAFVVHSHVSMWNCPPPLLQAYAESGEPLDKAGAYAIQGKGSFLIQKLEGSWTSVAGLPLAELVQTLLDIGAVTTVN